LVAVQLSIWVFMVRRYRLDSMICKSSVVFAAGSRILNLTQILKLCAEFCSLLLVKANIINKNSIKCLYLPSTALVIVQYSLRYFGALKFIYNDFQEVRK
jgi:hypothetical protein